MNRTRVAVALSLAVVGLTLGGCGDSAEQPPTSALPPGDAITTPATAPALEGSVAAPAGTEHTWPDKLTATLTKVEQVPTEWGVDVAAGRTIIRVTLEVVNNGPAPIPFEPGSDVAVIMYGPGRYETHAVTSYSYDDPAEDRKKSLYSEQPHQVPVGEKITFWDSGLVPADEVGVLAVQVALPAEEGIRDPYTFTDAHTLLKTVN